MDTSDTDPAVPPRFLNESERPTRTHFVILGMAWAGWLFDFYDLMMFSFLLIPIKKSLGLERRVALAPPGRDAGRHGPGRDPLRLPRRPGRTQDRPLLDDPDLFAGHLRLRLRAKRLVAARLPRHHRSRRRRRMGDRPDAGGRDLSGPDAGPLRRGDADGRAARDRRSPRSSAVSWSRPWPRAFGEEWGWRGCFFLAVIPALLVVFIRRSMPESDVWAGRSAPPGRRARARLQACPSAPRTTRGSAGSSSSAWCSP